MEEDVSKTHTIRGVVEEETWNQKCYMGNFDLASSVYAEKEILLFIKISFPSQINKICKTLMSRYDQKLGTNIAFGMATNSLGEQSIFCEGLYGCTQTVTDVKFEGDLDIDEGNFRAIIDTQRRQVIVYKPYANWASIEVNPTHFVYIEYDSEGNITNIIPVIFDKMYSEQIRQSTILVKTDFTAVFPNGKRYIMCLLSPNTKHNYKQTIFEIPLSKGSKTLEMRKLSEYEYSYIPTQTFTSNNRYKAPVFGSTDDGQYLFIFLDYHLILEIEEDDGEKRKGNLFVCEISLYKSDSEVEALLALNLDSLKKCRSTIQTIMDHDTLMVVPDVRKPIEIVFPYSFYTPISAQFSKKFDTLLVTFFHASYLPTKDSPGFKQGGQITQYFDFKPGVGLSLVRQSENRKEIVVTRGFFEYLTLNENYILRITVGDAMRYSLISQVKQELLLSMSWVQKSIEIPIFVFHESYLIYDESFQQKTLNEQLETEHHIWNVQENSLQASRSTYYVPFYDDATGLAYNKLDLLLNEGPRLHYWRKFNCGWDFCDFQVTDSNKPYFRNNKFNYRVLQYLPLEVKDKLEDFDLRDIGNKLYKSEIIDDEWLKTLNTVNQEFQLIDKSQISEDSCRLGDEVEFYCEYQKGYNIKRFRRYLLLHPNFEVTFQTYNSYFDYSCTKIMCDQRNRLIFVHYSDPEEGDFFLVAQFERDPKQKRKIYGREQLISIKGQIRIKMIREPKFTQSLFNPDTEVFARAYNTDDLIFKGLDTDSPQDTYLISFSYVWLEAGVAAKNYVGTSYIQFKSINDLSDNNLVTDRIYFKVNDPGNSLSYTVKKQLTYEDLRHHIPLKFQFSEYVSIDKGNGMMFEEDQEDSDFIFETEPRLQKFKGLTNILGFFLNQELLFFPERDPYIAILRQENSPINKRGQIIDVFDYLTQTLIYSVAIELKCLEISLSVVKISGPNEPSSQYDIIIGILDSELRIYTLTNDPTFGHHDKLLPIYAKVDLYDTETPGHAFGLKIDLVPRLSEHQVVYLVTHFEQSKNMLLYSYKRQLFQFDFDERFCIEGKIFADSFDLDRQEYDKDLPPYKYVFKLTSSFLFDPSNPKQIVIVTNFVMKLPFKKSTADSNSFKPTQSPTPEKNWQIQHMTFSAILDLSNNILYPVVEKFPQFKDPFFDEFGIQGYFVNFDNVKVDEEESNKYEYLIENETNLNYRNLDPSSVYSTNFMKVRLLKPSSTSGTQCVFLRDYIACAARIVCSRLDQTQASNQYPCNYLMIWEKPRYDNIKMNKVEVHTQRIIKLSPPPFSTKNSLLRVSIAKPNTILYLEKSSIPVEMTIDYDKIKFSVKPGRTNTLRMYLLGTDIQQSVPNSTAEHRLDISENQLVKAKSYLLLMCAATLILIVLSAACIFAVVKRRRRLEKEEDEELSPSFMDETVLEQIRSTRKLILDRSSVDHTLTDTSVLSQKELNDREDEIPEEFLEFFSNLKTHKLTNACTDFRISQEYPSRNSSEFRFSHEVNFEGNDTKKLRSKFRSSRQTKKNFQLIKFQT